MLLPAFVVQLNRPPGPNWLSGKTGNTFCPQCFSLVCRWMLWSVSFTPQYPHLHSLRILFGLAVCFPFLSALWPLTELPRDGSHMALASGNDRTYTPKSYSVLDATKSLFIWTSIAFKYRDGLGLDPYSAPNARRRTRSNRLVHCALPLWERSQMRHQSSPISIQFPWCPPITID